MPNPIPAALGLALGLAAPAVAQDAFKAFTQWRGTAMPLEVVAGGPLDALARLTPDGPAPGQVWTLLHDGPYLRFTSAAGGPDMCLDVRNGGALDHFVGLAPCGDRSGQLWTAREEEGGWFRLTSEFLGPDLCLDVANGGAMDGFAVMAPCGRYAGQLWAMN